MKIKTLQVGQLGANCYIVYDENTKSAAVIDPGGDPDRILKTAEESGLTIKYILLTHGHYDHVGGVEGLREKTGAPVYIHKLDEKDGLSAGLIDLEKGVVNFGEGDKITMDGLTFEILNTPGHTQGSCVLRCGDVLFTGDTLFEGSCGRTDFTGGSWAEMLKSLKRLADLPGDYLVLSGHGGSTTLDRERISNMFMLEAIGK